MTYFFPTTSVCFEPPLLKPTAALIFHTKSSFSLIFRNCDIYSFTIAVERIAVIIPMVKKSGSNILWKLIVKVI